MRYTTFVVLIAAISTLWVTPPLMAAVTPTGSVESEGGDSADDGPITPTAGDLILPATDRIIIGDLSSLLVDGGSSVQAAGIDIADTGTASLTVDTLGNLTLTNTIRAGLGANTDATLLVQGGATVNALSIYGSIGVNSTSSITFEGANTQVNLGDELVVGQLGAGDLSILNGASLTIGGGPETGFIGSTLMIGTTGGTGTGLIDNASVLLNPNVGQPEVRISVGVLGTGDLTIQGGADVRVEDLTGGLGLLGDGVTVGEAGLGLDAAGTLTIQGAGTTLELESIDAVGFVAGISANGVETATGTINVLDGATVSILGTGLNSGINIGRGGNSTGVLNVSGSGTLIDVVGPQGIIAIASNFGGAVGDTTASMSVTDGAVVTLAGLTPGQGFFSVGNGAGTGTLDVNTGGRIDIDGSLRISVGNANGNTQVGTVTVTDTGVINALRVEVSERGLLTGDGTVTADTLDILTGATVDLDSLAGFSVVNINGGQYDAPSGTIDIDGQTVNLTNSGTWFGGDAINLGASGLATTLSIADTGSLFDTAGDVTVNGDLILDTGGTLSTTGNVFINAGGRLSGDGGFLTALTTNVGAGGIVGPGNSPGILNITGDFVLDGGLLEFEIAGTAPGEFDVINVDGDVDLLSGSVSVALLNGFNPGGQSFDVISATGTLTLDPAVTFLNAGPGPDFVFSTRTEGGFDLGTITFTARNIGTVAGLSDFQQRTAVYLDAVCPQIEAVGATGGDALDLDARCGALRSGATTDAQVATALAQLTPDEIVGTFTGLVRFSPLQHGNLSRRLNGLRGGADRVNLSNLNIVTENAQVSGSDLQNVLEKLTQQKFGRWGFFSEGRINFGERDDTRRSPGYDFDTTALTIGTDYKLRDNLFLGAALGYNEADADYDVGGGVTMQSYSLSLLGTYFRGDSFYVDSLLTYAVSDIDTDRRIVYADFSESINRRARGRTDGDQLALGLGSGFDFARGRWVWGPHAGINYSDTQIDGFQERGASGLNLALPDATYKSLTMNVGLHASVTLTPSWGVVVPYAQIDFVREYENDSQDERVRFVQDTFARDPLNPTAPLTVESGGIDANHVSWAVGVHLQLINGIAGFIDYRGTQGLSEFSVNEIAAGLRFERRLP